MKKWKNIKIYIAELLKKNKISKEKTISKGNQVKQKKKKNRGRDVLQYLSVQVGKRRGKSIIYEN